MLTSVSAALTQFNANAAWYLSNASAQLRLEAVEYLMVNRAQKIEDQGSTLNYESLADQALVLRKFLGAGSPRAFGRSRRTGVAFRSGGVG